MDKAILEKLKIERQAPAAAGLPRARRGRFAMLFGMALAMAALAWAGYALLYDRPVSVAVATVAPVQPSQAFSLLQATGYVVPQTKADVATKATGRLEKLEVDEGSRVRKDQILARLDNRDLLAQREEAAQQVRIARTQLRRARAELREATLALDRARALIGRNFVSREYHDAAVARHAKAEAEVAAAEAGIRAAEAAYRVAEVQVEYTLIRAPFDGVVLKKFADVGDVVAPFAAATQSKGAVVSMADLSTLEVEADVSEANLSQVKLGQPCEIQLDALPAIRYRGEVRRIMPTVDKTKATVLVKVAFLDRDERILPDMSAKVAFLSRSLSEAQRVPVTAVSRRALRRRGANLVVFRIEGERARETPVEVGQELGDWAEVRAGLALGDRVVLDPPESLRSGSRVRVAGAP